MFFNEILWNFQGFSWAFRGFNGFNLISTTISKCIEKNDIQNPKDLQNYRSFGKMEWKAVKVEIKKILRSLKIRKQHSKTPKKWRFDLFRMLRHNFCVYFSIQTRIFVRRYTLPTKFLNCESISIAKCCRPPFNCPVIYAKKLNAIKKIHNIKTFY